MKKEINKEVLFCDVCGKEMEYGYVCNSCGKEICYECKRDLMITYPHSTCCSGSGDGEYCNECDIKLLASRKDKLHNAYVKVRELRNEQKAYYEDFNKRAKEAEKKVEELRAD